MKYFSQINNIEKKFLCYNILCNQSYIIDIILFSKAYPLNPSGISR